MVGLASAAGLIGFLSEPDPELRVFALKTLDTEVDLLWTEIVDAIPQMYVINPKNFFSRMLAFLFRFRSAALC
jgi:26S proteasome regulatory subunit N2